MHERLESAPKASTVSSSLGWWTKRIHMAHFSHSGSSTTSNSLGDMEDALVGIVSKCPNLEIFIVDWPMGNTFGLVANALASSAKRCLRTISWRVAYAAVGKVVWAINALPNLVSARLEFDFPLNDHSDGSVHMGAAGNISITLPKLQQLSVHGQIQDFLEEATSWELPSLRSLTIDCGVSRVDQPDVIAFLKEHGRRLVFLNLYCIPPLDVPTILDLCPALQTFAFDADWHFDGPQSNHVVGKGELVTMTSLVNKQHQNITSIGLHGLHLAFGVGTVATSVDALRARIIRRANDFNFAALNTTYFPRLKCIRALDRPLLNHLNDAGGPSPEDGCIARWETWWDRCHAMGIRLEDCTGTELGNLPEPVEDEESDSDSDEDSDEYEYEDEDSWARMLDAEETDDEDDGHTGELRHLIRECRRLDMEEDAYEDSLDSIPVILFNDGDGPLEPEEHNLDSLKL